MYTTLYKLSVAFLIFLFLFLFFYDKYVSVLFFGAAIIVSHVYSYLFCCHSDEKLEMS